MTIDEAIYCMMSYLPSKGVDHCIKCPYYGNKDIGSNVSICRSADAHLLAIQALTKERDDYSDTAIIRRLHALYFGPAKMEEEE